MSRAQAKEVTSPLSLFPFIGILLSTMGALLVVLIAVSRSARDSALRDVKAQRAAQQTANQAADSDEDQLKLAKITQYVDRLKDVRMQAAQQLRDDQLRLSHAEVHMRELEDKLASLRAAADELESQDKNHLDDRRQAEREVDRLRQLIAETRERIDAARTEVSAKKRSFAVIPYEGPNGTERRPIYIECRKDEVIVQPEGIRLTVNDFQPPLDAGNPLATALRAAREHVVRQIGGAPNKQAEPYPLILVRPDGVVAYYKVRDAISSWDADFGYEFIGSDWKLKYQQPDPQLAQIEQQAVEQARLRRQVLAAAAPRAYRSGGGVGGGGGGGGFVDDDDDDGLGFDGGAGDRYGSDVGGAPGGGFAGGGDSGAGGGGSPGGRSQFSNERPGGANNVTSVEHGNSGLGNTDASMRGSHSPGRGGSASAPGGLGSGGGPYAGLGSNGPNRSATPGAEMPAGTNERSSAGDGRGSALEPQSGDLASAGGPNPSGSPGPPGAGVAGNGPGGPAASGSATPGAAGGGGASQSASGANGEMGSNSAMASGLSTLPPAKVHDLPAPITPQDLAKSRGANWALAGKAAAAVPVRRSIQIVVREDRVAILPESSTSDQTPPAQEVRLNGPTLANVDDVVAAVRGRIGEWGIAGHGLYWRPVLVLHVWPDGQRRADELAQLLKDSGIELRSNTAAHPPVPGERR